MAKKTTTVDKPQPEKKAEKKVTQADKKADKIEKNLSEEQKAELKKIRSPKGTVIKTVLEDDKPKPKTTMASSAPMPRHRPATPPPPSPLATEILRQAQAAQASASQPRTAPLSTPQPSQLSRAATPPPPIPPRPIAPISSPYHKIKSPAVPVQTLSKSLAVFIDLDNTFATLDNLTELFGVLKGRGNITYGKVYGYTDDKVSEFEEFIAEHRLKTAGMMRFKPEARSSVDTRLITDVFRITRDHRFSEVFVWAGVGDLVPVFTMIKDTGAKVLTVDMPMFDANNKFVDHKIKLYSPHPGVDGAPQPRQTTAQPVQAPGPDPLKDVSPVASPSPVSPADSSNAMPWMQSEAFAGADASLDDDKPLSGPDPMMFAGQKIPELPRKRNAPAFGERDSGVTAAPVFNAEEPMMLDEDAMLEAALEALRMAGLEEPESGGGMPELPPLPDLPPFPGLEDVIKPNAPLPSRTGGLPPLPPAPSSGGGSDFNDFGTL